MRQQTLGKLTQTGVVVAHAVRHDPFHTRLTLLERVLAADEGGWKEFYAIYSPLIRWLCTRRGVASEEQSDLVVQAVMVHFATTAWSHDQGLGKFRNLVLRVAELKMHEVRRELTTGRTEPLPRNTAELMTTSDEPDEIQERQLRLRLALQELHADPDLPERDRRVLELALAGCSSPEIAAAVAVTINNARVIKHRMLTRLRTVLERLAS